MGFIDSFKKLEKLCSELYDTNHGVSTYIDEMTNTPKGSLCVPGWDDDLKLLKHYRWMRNKIAHEPDCTEENMCAPKDEKWLDDFYSRIMTSNDPLALYHKAKHPKKVKSPKKEDPEKPNFMAVFFSILLFLFAIGLFLTFIILLFFK